MNQKNTNHATKILNLFLGFGWYTGTSSVNRNTFTSVRLFSKIINNKKG